MQAIGIVSVLASAAVALVATVVTARTQIRLHHLERTDARLAELRDVIDNAAQVLVRAKYALADADDLQEHFDWDREFWAVEARLQVRLGSDLQLYDDFIRIWGELHDLKQTYARGSHVSDDRAVELWENVHSAMDRFFEDAAAVLGPDPSSLDPPPPRASVAEWVRYLRFRWRLRRISGREGSRERHSAI